MLKQGVQYDPIDRDLLKLFKPNFLLIDTFALNSSLLS